MVSSKIFNSDENCFAYIDKMSLDKDRDNTNLRKGILETIAKYIKMRKNLVYEYVSLI